MSDIGTLRLSDWIARDKSPEEIGRQEKISELLSFLSVPENPDVERFAYKNAIPYEKANKGRTNAILPCASLFCISDIPVVVEDEAAGLPVKEERTLRPSPDG